MATGGGKVERQLVGGASAAAEPKPWHGAGGRFRNLPDVPSARGTRRAWWAFAWRRFLEGRWPPAPLSGEWVLPPAEIKAGLAAAGSGDALTWLGHSCFLVTQGGRRILTDPFLSDVASPYDWFGPRRHTPPGLRARELPPIDLVLISHAHYDHLDRPALAALPGRERATLVAGLGMRRYVEDLGFARIVETDWHEGHDLGGLRVTGMPAIHFSRRTAFDRNRALWCGFLVETPGFRLYFAGDTAYGPVFAEMGRRHPPPDLALVPIGAYAPRPLMRAVHCSPEEAVAIGHDLGAHILCAMHWGAIRLTDEPTVEPPTRFRAATAAAGYPSARAWLLKVGETRALEGIRGQRA
jgi:L-ascorbate metabolism protein UlaG (beta-lactamase superfamily)